MIIKYWKCANIFAEKMWVAFAFAKATHIFFSKNSCELNTVLPRTVNILTTNELIKLMMLWTTGPWPATWENILSDMCTQGRLISLCIHAVWSVFIFGMKKLCILGYPKCSLEDSDQTMQMCRLILIFAGHTCPQECFWHCGSISSPCH